MVPNGKRTRQNKTVNASGYVFGDSIAKLLKMYLVIQRGS